MTIPRIMRCFLAIFLSLNLFASYQADDLNNTSRPQYLQLVRDNEEILTIPLTKPHLLYIKRDQTKKAPTTWTHKVFLLAAFIANVSLAIAGTDALYATLNRIFST